MFSKSGTIKSYVDLESNKSTKISFGILLLDLKEHLRTSIGTKKCFFL